MAIITRVKGNTTEITKGETYSKNFPVDDNAVTVAGGKGIETGSFFAVKGDGASKEFYKGIEGGVGATAIKADATDMTKEAVGIVVTSSTKDKYAGRNISTDAIMFPVGVAQENGCVPPIRNVELSIIDDTNPRGFVFNTKTVELTGTVAIAGDTSVTGTSTLFTTELEVGDLIMVDGEIREVKTITDNTNIVVSVAFTGTASGKKGYQWCDYGRKVYLDTLGKWTKIEPVASGEFKQELGFISSGNNITVEIKKGIVLA